MSDKKISEITHRLVHDRSFIMWCLTPTEELNAIWFSWLEEHPEEQLAADQARAILKSVRLNDFSVPADKSEQLWAGLQITMQKRHAGKRVRLIRYAAACVAVLLLGITGFGFWGESWFSQNQVADTGLIVDSTRTEVTLILDTRETVQVEDNALIAYDSEITVKAKEKERTIAKKVTEDDPEKIVMNTLVVPKGRRSSLLLEDGSKVWVNSGSILHFPSSFEPSQRSIEVEGEIYIEVARKEIPFYVKTKGFVVNVLGTKFNISAYEEEQESSVVLVEGHVAVETTNNETIQLLPNRKLTIQEGRNEIDEVDVYDYISWKDGLLQFRGETMDNILMRLSRYYNIPIRCKSGIGDRRSSGKLVLFDDIHQVMETFSILYNTQYHFESDTLIIE